MSKVQDLYNHAKTCIPGDTQLLSKRPEMFAPDQCPNYFTKAKGCELWAKSITCPLEPAVSLATPASIVRFPNLLHHL